MMMKAIVALGLMTGGATAASAAVLYDNGPIDGQDVGYTINNGYAVSNSFTLSADSVLTGVTFGAWTFGGEVPTSVDWGITTQPNTYTNNGTADVTNSGTFANGYGYNVSSASFSLPNLSLSKGTYYLVLQNAVSSAGGYAYWDANNGPSSASQNGLDLANQSFPGTNSESFQIIGNAAAVPEPATWAMMIGGVGVAGGAMRRRQKPRVSVSFA